MYKYWAYGLSILSEVEFPELVPYLFDDPDVTIRQGTVPEHLEGDDVVRKVRVSIRPFEYLLDIQNVASYYSANQNEIIFQPAIGSDARSIRLFLLENAMAAILHQRNTILMHASAIEYKDGIVMFFGRSGAGKSTLVSALKQLGYTVFSDDVCVLKYSNEPNSSPLACPAYPVMKLWEDSFEKLGLDLPNNKFKLRPDLPKYATFYHDVFNTASKKVLYGFILNPNILAEKIEIKKNDNLEAFLRLHKSIFSHMQINAMKKRNLHFSLVSELAGSIPVYTVTRPVDINTVNSLTDLIVTHLRKYDSSS